MGWTSTVVLIDDGSTDDTLAVAKSFGERFGIDIRCISGPAEGLGRAVLTGLQAALEENPTVIVTLDADGQHDAREIPTLVRVHRARRSDLTIGSRWTRGGRSPGTTSFRMAGSRFGNAAFRGITGTRGVSDATTAFRVISPRLARFMLASSLRTFRGYSFFSASVGLAESAGFRISEVPITFRPRFGGSSKLSRGEVGAFFRALPAIRRARRDLVHGNDDVEYLASDELDMLGEARRWQRYLLNAALSPLRNTPTRRVVEVGAGRGGVLPELEALFPDAEEILAIEPDAANFSVLRQAVESRGAAVHAEQLRSDQLLARAGQSGSWDVMLYSNVLEHIVDDVAELRCAAQLLRPGGHVAICVPALSGLYGAVDARSGHQRRYNTRTLRETAEAAGFQVRLCSYIDSLGVVPYWASFRLLNRASFSAGAVQIFDNAYVPVTMAFDRLTPRTVPGKTVVCLAQLSA
jgi:dolichol-phosphate mannosyltransferase